jgi:LacI family transcriptional regulator
MPAKRAQRVSIVDVAKAAGVSIGTASNVLNKPDRVAPATRERVEEAIARLNYVPSGAARALRSGQILTVGAILLDIRNPLYTDVARGIEDRLDEEGFTLIFGSSDGDPDREARYLTLFESRGVAGLILSPVEESGPLLQDISDRGVPLVLLEGSFPDVVASSVLIDNAAGGEMAARHLAQIGCPKMVFFNGPDDVRQCVDRREGALKGWTGSGRSADTFLEIKVPGMNMEGGDAAVRAWCDTEPDPCTGLFCINDVTALGVQRALRFRAVYDPAVYPIVGFDDIEIAAALATPLTTVRQPTYEIGRRAADLLLHRRDQAPVERVTIMPELIVRESTVPK